MHKTQTGLIWPLVLGLISLRYYYAFDLIAIYDVNK